AGLRGETDRAVLQSLASCLNWIGDHALPQAATTAFEGFIGSIWRRELDSLGWDRRADDSPDERERRSLALTSLARGANDAAVRREARRRVDAHFAGQRIDPDIAGAVVSAAAADGDVALYERYVARMKESEKTDAQEEARFRGALTQFRDAAIVKRL